MRIVWIDPNIFYLYPNSIQTGGVVQFCRSVLGIVIVYLVDQVYLGIYRVFFSLFLPIFSTKIKKIMGSQSDSAFHKVGAEQQSS